MQIQIQIKSFISIPYCHYHFYVRVHLYAYSYVYVCSHFYIYSDFYFYFHCHFYSHFIFTFINFLCQLWLLDSYPFHYLS